MTAADRERMRLEKLLEMKIENGVNVESAQREERSGPAAAYREELRRRTAWRVPRELKGYRYPAWPAR